MNLHRGAVSMITVAVAVSPWVLAAQDPEPPAFRSGVELVQVAVSVRDRAGELVGGLSRDDFEIFDSGVRQRIAAFERVEIPYTSYPTPRLHRTDVASSQGASEARLFVLVLDDLHIEPALSPRVRQEARRFVSRFTGPQDLVMIVPTGGNVDFFLEFTTDKARLLDTLDGFIGRTPTGRTSFEARYTAGATLQVIRDLGRHLAAAHRRIAMLVFTEGFSLHALGSGSSTQVTSAFRKALDAVAASNVALYLVDPKGLVPRIPSGGPPSVPPSASAVAPSGGSSYGSIQDDNRWDLENLRDLADGTGGFAAIARNDFDTVFEQILRENSTFYVLGYSPEPGDSRRRRREIEVRVPGADVRVTARKAHITVEPSDDTASDSEGVRPALARALRSPTPLDGLGLRLQVIPFRRGGESSATVVLELTGADLTRTQASGASSERLDLAVRFLDTRGRQRKATSASLDLTSHELDRARAEGVRWLWSTELDPGRYQVRLAAAGASGRAGLVTADVVIPRFDSKRLGMSGIVISTPAASRFLTKPQEGRRLQEGRTSVRPLSGESTADSSGALFPTTIRRFPQGDVITTVVELYPPRGSSSSVVARAEVLSADGTSHLEKTETIEPGAAQAGAAATFRVPTEGLPAGDYVLRVRARMEGDKDEDQTVERTVALEIIDAENRGGLWRN